LTALSNERESPRGKPAASEEGAYENFASTSMNELTRILSEAARGDGHAAEQLLPLVYDELRKLAAVRMAAENPGNTLSATALVHEAYLRLVGPQDGQQWDHRGHFFAAAAEAMRRILVDRARKKASTKRGGELTRIELEPDLAAAPEVQEDLVALDDALNRLAADYPVQAEVVKLRYFAGLSLPEAAAALEISERTAGRHWAFARAWLRREVEGNAEKS
jgi:RNA polymerase sigma factor (TIGR02999 family)